MKRNSLASLLGFTSTILFVPGTVQAQIFDYDRLEFIEPRPLPANGTLFLFGDQNQNEGYVGYSNLDRNAPDAGHVGFRGDLNARYYATGRERSPEQTGATRSATLERLTDFPNLTNYLNNSSIPLSDIGYGFGQKEGLSVTQALNLGEDVLGQDWFGRPNSPVEEFIYRANPENIDYYLTYQNTKIVSLGYSNIFFIGADDNPGSIFGNPNIFFSNPTSPSIVPDLDEVAAGIANSFLQDVTAGGGKIQQISEDILEPEDISVSVDQEFEIFTLPLPLELRVVSVPEPSSTLALMLFVGGGIITCAGQRQRND